MEVLIFLPTDHTDKHGYFRAINTSVFIRVIRGRVYAFIAIMDTKLKHWSQTSQ